MKKYKNCQSCGMPIKKTLKKAEQIQTGQKLNVLQLLLSKREIYPTRTYSAPWISLLLI